MNNLAAQQKASTYQDQEMAGCFLEAFRHLDLIPIPLKPKSKVPHFRTPRGLLPPNSEMALGYLALGYRPIPLICDKNGSWVPAVKWAPFQHETPTRQEIVDWWTKYPYAGITLICGWEAGLLVLDVDPRHGGIGPKLAAPVCSMPRVGAHYHLVAPAPIPELEGQGLEWLGDGHIARVPPATGGSTGAFRQGEPPTSLKICHLH